MEVVERSRPGASASGRAVPVRRGRLLVPLLLALVAVVGSALLPLAPVRMSVPTVTWPQDPARPESTVLELTSQRPLGVDVRVGCPAVRAAADTAEGVVVSTLLPSHPAALTDGLLVTAREDRLQVRLRGRELLDVHVPSGDCTYRLTGDAGALTLTRDGVEVTTATADGGLLLPDVDVLATSVTALPAGAELAVTLTVDDQFDTTPTPVKQVLVALVLLAAGASLFVLGRAERRHGPAPGATDGSGPPRSRSRGAVRVLTVLVDAGVVATAVLWLFLAPTSDDDGYYAAMARNAEESGFVGNYYQLLNQSFTPFTWSYRVLGWWQQFGDAPVLLRVPSLVTGLLTWVVLRRLVTRPGAVPAAVTASRWGPLGLQVTLAVAFLAWWLPYGIGVRPEAVVGVLAVVTLAAVLSGLRRRRLLPIAVAVGTAGLAVVCHPTGFVALGPLLVALPRLARLVSAGAGRGETVTRVALLLAPGGFAAAAAFADGTLRDFLRGQEIFLSVQDQDTWYEEQERYGFLFADIPMGSYARRAAVVLALLALLWFLAGAVAVRSRGARLPSALLLSGQALAAAFLLLWFTPSKWTHHFGALAGLGPAFLALFLVAVPLLVREATRGRRPGAVLPLLAVGSVVFAAALALHGPNSWPYTWMPGMFRPFEPPTVGPVAFDSLLTWGLVAAVVLGGAALLHRRTGRLPGRWWAGALPVLALLPLLTSVGYLVGSFGLAAVRTLDTWSPGADALTDPLATGCGAAGAVDVLDVSAARGLTVDPSVPAGTGPADFADGGGWWAPSPPPSPVARRVWGSLAAPEAEDLTGDQVTPWYRLPEQTDGAALALLAAGRLGEGNELRAEYARPGGGDGSAPEVVGEQALTDDVDQPRWRTAVLDPADARADGATLVRLLARDRSGGAGGWLAFTAPAVLPWVPLTDVLPPDATVAVAWQVAFLFPCQQQPVVRSGVTEPVTYGVLWGEGADGPADNTWQVYRGGLFAPVQRTSAVTEYAVDLSGSPGVRSIQVFRFDLPFATDAYDLVRSRVERPGWGAPPAR
ncbi:arabinosyltransferase domain-containing protein [Geodermatophilus sp. SYSU D01036]